MTMKRKSTHVIHLESHDFQKFLMRNFGTKCGEIKCCHRAYGTFSIHFFNGIDDMLIILNNPKGLDLGIETRFCVVSFHLPIKESENFSYSFRKRFDRTIWSSNDESEFERILMKFRSPINMR